MKINKKQVLLALIATFLLTACGEEIIQRLNLLDYIALNAGTEGTINISAGNPPYRIELSDAAIATATVKDSVITVKAHKEGEATLLLTDKTNQHVAIKVSVGIPPIEFTKEYTAETMQTVLSEFGIGWEEFDEQGAGHIRIKPAGADKLLYFTSNKRWIGMVITSKTIIKGLNSVNPLLIDDKGLTFKTAEEELYHYYFGVLYKEQYYFLNIYDVEKKADVTGKEVTIVRGAYIKAVQ